MGHRSNTSNLSAPDRGAILRALAACFVALGVLIVAVDAVAAPAGKKRHSGDGGETVPTECLVRLDVAYAAIRDPSFMGNIFSSFNKYSMVVKPDTPDIRMAWVDRKRIGMAWADRTRIYLLFLDGCEQRFRTARAMVKAHLAAHPAEVRLAVREVTVHPVHEIRKLHFFDVRRRYKRADCIVRLDVDYYPLRASATVATRFARFLMKYAAENFRYEPAFEFQWQTDSRLFLLFAGACDLRFARVQEMVAAYNAEFPDEISVTVSKERIQPGPKTINSSGPLWIDGGSE